MRISSGHRLFYMAASIVALALTTTIVGAQTPKIPSTGPISIDAKDSEVAPGYGLYHFATVTMKDRSTLYADEIKAYWTKQNKWQKATAIGNVKAIINDVRDNAKYVVTADNGEYDPLANTIDLSGNVKSVTNGGSDTPGDQKSYSVIATADHAIFDMTANTVNLTGNVKTLINSAGTEGPIVQTGTSALISLGKGSDFPKIDMQQVHTELTLKQK